MKLSLAQLQQRATVSGFDDGFVEAVAAAGDVSGDSVEIDRGVYRHLRRAAQGRPTFGDPRPDSVAAVNAPCCDPPPE